MTTTQAIHALTLPYIGGGPPPPPPPPAINNDRSRIIFHGRCHGKTDGPDIGRGRLFWGQGFSLLDFRLHGFQRLWLRGLQRLCLCNQSLHINTIQIASVHLLSITLEVGSKTVVIRQPVTSQMLLND